MGLIDIVIVSLLALGLVFGYWRGFAAEMRVLSAWVIALYGAKWLAPILAGMLKAHFPAAWLIPMASVILFFGLRLFCSLLFALLFAVVGSSGVRGVSRVLGAIAGVVRALFQMMVYILVLTWLGANHYELWQASYFLKILAPMTRQFLG